MRLALSPLCPDGPPAPSGAPQETAPGGIVTSIYGSTPDSRGPHPFKGYDINGLDTAAALSAINRRAMTLAGPFNLSAEYYKAGLYAGIKVRFPVFIPNAQSTNASDPWATPGYGYDQPFGLLNATTGKYKFSSLRPSKCSSDCRTQQDWFWGFSVAMLDLNAIERNSGLRDLYAEGYEYRLYYTSPSNITFLIAGERPGAARTSRRLPTQQTARSCG